MYIYNNPRSGAYYLVAVERGYNHIALEEPALAVHVMCAANDGTHM